jgi:phosphoglycolate phosphatase-like HAD superfamily hydrolase
LKKAFKPKRFSQKIERSANNETTFVADLVQAVTSADDAEHSKPAPDIIEVALAKMAHPRNTVIMLGDTPYDLAAAMHAGIAMIALRCGGWQDMDLQDAVAIYDDPADSLANFAMSPLAADQLVMA